jgi:hypothetical protein
MFGQFLRNKNKIAMLYSNSGCVKLGKNKACLTEYAPLPCEMFLQPVARSIASHALSNQLPFRFASSTPRWAPLVSSSEARAVRCDQLSITLAWFEQHSAQMQIQRSNHRWVNPCLPYFFISFQFTAFACLFIPVQRMNLILTDFNIYVIWA